MHPEISVKEVLRLAMPEGTRLVAGNLSAKIAWVRRTRVQPPAFLNLEPGELVLLSTETLRLVDERLTLDRVIESLAGMGIAAIGVQGEIDNATVEQAEVFDLPLLALPDDVSLLEVERTVSRLLLDREAQLERRGQEIAALLAGLAAENRGLEAILEAVTHTTGKVAAIHDLNGEPVVYTALGGVPALEIDELETALSTNGSTGAIVASGYTVPLVVEGRRAGYLTIVNGGQFDDLDRMAAERGAMVCAMELAKQKAVVDAETRVRGDWVQRWLSGDLQDAADLEAHAAQAGLDLAGIYMAMLYHADSGTEERLAGLLREELASRRIAGVVGQAPEGVLLLYPVETVPRALQVGAAIRDTLIQRLDMEVACGIGRAYGGLKNLRKSCRQAERALQMGYELFGKRALVYFGGLSLYRLLLSVDDIQELRQFCHDALGAAIDYDERYESDLVHTLEVFFANNGNLARTADELCVHRNTLSYRLGRVAEITGLDLEDAENRLMLHLALKAQRVLQATE